MSIGPILPGRIPATLLTSRLQQNLQRNNRLLLQIQDQIATGQKFFLPSDSPAAAVRTMSLQRTIERKSQMLTNVRTDQGLLSATESSLATVGDALNQAKALLLAGTGESSTSAEKDALASEVASLVETVVIAGNARFAGRYLFGGSQTGQAPFENAAGGVVRYSGDRLSIDSYIDLDFLQANNIDGASAFKALSDPIGQDVDPSLTLETKIRDLHGGAGVTLGTIEVTVDDGVNPVQTKTVDLTGAETIGDLKTLLEDAFSGPAPNLTVEIDPASNNGLRLVPSAGTVAVADFPGSRVASDLGIEQAAATTINGLDLNPRITLLTRLADLNNGAGVAQTPGQGLLINNGSKSKTVDISGATTVEDLFNILKSENLDLHLGINSAGNGLAISSRLSGADFSIGESGDTSAADLGIRTIADDTLLKDLNLGLGVPVNELDGNGDLLPALLEITRRDGTTTNVDLKGLNTVQEVIDAIGAVDANLTASLNSVGNGISLLDTSGTGPLVVVEGPVATALGLVGDETGVDNTVPLVGQEIHPRQSDGVLSILVQLENTLRSEDNDELARLDRLINEEIERFNLVRGEIGDRLRVLDEVENRLLDEDVVLQQTLSKEFDTDLTTAITEFSAVSATLEATLQVAAAQVQLSLLNFL